MNIRELIAKYSKSSLVVIALCSLGAGYYAYRSSSSDDISSGDTFFTRDEGKSFFSDDGRKFPQYERSNPPVYRAAVAAGDNGKRFVAYVMRTPPELMQQIDKTVAELKALPPNASGDLSLKLGLKRDDLIARAQNEMEVLRPGNGTKWVSSQSPEGDDVIHHIQSPPGTKGTPQLVNP